MVAVLLALDLIAHRGSRGESRKRTLIWSIVWVAAGLAFDGLIWMLFGGKAAGEYLAAWLMEKSLSLDNLFIFLIIFKSLGVAKRYQHRVLFWGILGAVVFRALFIFLGAAALERWDWVTWIFAALLVYGAWRSVRVDPSEEKESPVVGWLARHVPVTQKVRSRSFVAREGGRWVATPLLIALVAIEISDVMFAVDSVPAAFSVTREPFLVYSSNIFAILGLRALYLLLAQTIGELRYLHYGLALVLVFAAFKMVADTWMEIPPLMSVAVIMAIIGAAAWLSIRARRSETSP